MQPKVIAHRSRATRGEMLVNPPNWEEFKHKALINDQASNTVGSSVFYWIAVRNSFPAAVLTGLRLHLLPAGHQ